MYKTNVPDSKKLSLDDAKKTLLGQALRETADGMDRYMRRIYDDTLESVRRAGDRILLAAAQVNIVKYALERHESIHGPTPEARTMLLQLTLTRKEFQAMAEG